jgi:hypothetical protein
MRARPSEMHASLRRAAEATDTRPSLLSSSALPLDPLWDVTSSFCGAPVSLCLLAWPMAC